MLLSVIATGLLMLAPDQAAQPVAASTATEAVQTAAVAAEAETTAAANKRICKRSTPTGSMIASRRECRTAAEWDRLAEAARAHGNDVVDRGRGGMVSN
ncbi:hypothetical protein V5740_12305 [Croceibacterium sp. TMG7-5b_MA50]|uniref:hypothetical protein n=1 Tax=Croceibacterium sp. TMG7-5b_MA50 TaxID=3121290 RepID=UPI0032219103